MWALRMFMTILFLAGAITFYTYNINERVDVSLMHTRFLDVPLFAVLTIAFILGMIASFLLAVTYFFRISSESAANKRLIKRLEAEITSLRNRQIDQIDSV